MGAKRIFIIIALLLANLSLLAHNVLPHFHHDGIVCFSLEELAHHNHCSEHHDDVCNCCCENDKEKDHHHHGDFDDCTLTEILLRQANNQHDDTLPCLHCLSLLYTLYSLNEFYLEAPLFGEKVRQKPYANHYIPPYVGSIKSLRAPPYSYLFA